MAGLKRQDGRLQYVLGNMFRGSLFVRVCMRQTVIDDVSYHIGLDASRQ